MRANPKHLALSLISRLAVDFEVETLKLEFLKLRFLELEIVLTCFLLGKKLELLRVSEISTISWSKSMAKQIFEIDFQNLIQNLWLNAN